MKNFAILRDAEEENDTVKANVLYTFKYGKKDEFFILTPEGWELECSTAFDFITKNELDSKPIKR